ncbi:EAL domain-containing protein [Cytobacillus spongiae]|uniref:bifunctional diguanylate cyclase/phosphodiesterase n=1 Tax=Cytobacillus spongiae TaxID=2901381 RepID=UPI001F22CFC5|nr:EAL domain-containing protein [Cytobacillus spongiae]UII56951.1 EAL domain-containing protein [Cytobacillus spongiae]
MVKTISCLYENDNQLNSFIDLHDLFEYPNLLVQVFSGINDTRRLKEVQRTLSESLPTSTILGCTTAGEMMDGELYEGQIVLNFTIFEKTELNSVLLNQSFYKDSFEMGKQLATSLSSYDTKAIILFSADEKVDVQLLLNGIYEVSPELIISGGVAGDYGQFEQSFVFNETEIISSGVVAVALRSEQLQVRTYTNYKWHEIGQAFTVTKSKDNVIYSIDHRKPLQIIRHYLGDIFVEGLPLSGVEFPFLLEENGEKISIFITKVLANGAVEVNRSVIEGKKLTFSYANLQGIIEDSLQELKKLSKHPVESIFIYNCMARKRMIRPFTEYELQTFNRIAPTCGFFCYGEFATKTKAPTQLVGHTLTYLALSETYEVQNRTSISPNFVVPENMKVIDSLTHLMQASQADIRTLNEHLSVSEQYYRSLFDNNADFVYSTDLQGNFTSTNPAFEATFGYSQEEVLGKSALKFIHQQDIPRVRMHFYRALKGKEQYYNIEIQSKDKEVQLFQLKNIPITVDGERVGIYGIGRNITEQKIIEDKIIQLAYFDQDTGLPNRLKLTEQLKELIQRAKKKKRSLAVMFIDMDRFKLINDSLGHYAGDLILKDLIRRVRKSLPKGAFLGRFGGDKLSLLLSKDVSIEEVTKIANNILEKVSKPVFFENQEFFVTASIGVSMFPSDGLDETTLLKNADISMNRSKNHGGNLLTFFSNEMNEQALVRLELESYLRKALQKNEFYLCYQPLIDLHTGAIYGSEALIRWEHPLRGTVSPGEFIPLAEETGLINDIGSWVLRTACRQTKEWHERGLGELTISVNVSAYQFQQPGFINDVKRALAESRLDPQYLTLELTESTMLRNIDHSIITMKQLQVMGVKVSIDDFGTGYSSLSYLRSLPINTLKIDRSFINNLRLDTSDIAIVKAIITMGHGLAVKVVAEGVETKEQIELLKELKCHYAQGFYIQKPLKIADFERNFSKTVI